MTFREVIRMGHPVLRQVGSIVPINQIKTEDIQSLIQDLKVTMAEKKGLGIAAPQIAVSKQVCIIQIPEYNQRYGKLKAYPLTIVINPEVVVLDQNSQGFWEGCLSIPGIRGYVRRPRKIRVKFYNQKAQEVVLELEGLSAVIFQHEVDHLFGILFIDKMEPKKITFIEQFDKFQLYKSQKVLDD